MDGTEKISLEVLVDLAKSLEKIITQFQITTLKRSLEAYSSLFKTEQIIDVAILGQFKAGKSSFLNSIIGKQVLPVGVIPVTTAITRLQYGASERAVVTHYDGKKTHISIEEVGEYNSESKNPSNEKNVEVIDIYLPTLKEYTGLRLVDTPGLGSVFQYHKATAENWLPEVGAAILAISADRPLSEHDLQLIRELASYTPRIVLLLTKVDLLTPEQRAEVVSFFKNILLRELNQEFPIYLYSTKIDTEKLKSQLDDELFRKMVANKGREFAAIARHKGKSIALSCRKYLEIALQTSQKADEEREHLKKLIFDEKVNYDLVREEMFIITREAQSQTRTLIANYLAHFEAPLVKKITQQMKEEMPKWRGNLWRLTRTYEQWITDVMNNEIQQISRKEHKHFFGTLKKAHASLTRSIESFRRLLNDNIQRVLGVSLGEVDWQLEIPEPEHPDVRLPRTFAYHLDLLWFLIPMFIFRGIFEKNFLKKIPWEVEVNLSRLAAQWETRINKAIETMRNQALRYVEEELHTIETLLAQASGRTPEIQKYISELDESLTLLN
ncbi:MAG: dynamin family protein [Syntrophales bacterium]|nr:dynamin family protein [Syntrophales bacterium]